MKYEILAMLKQGKGAIPYRGAPTGLDAHASAQRGPAGPRGLTLWAHEPDSRSFG